MTIDQLHNAYTKKELTVTEVVLAHLSRIAKIDSNETGLKSVIEINPDAIFLAKAMDKELEDMDNLPPLFGIPILLKDNINTNDRMHTTAASVSLKDNYAPYDAHIVEKIRAAGALILGKLNMTEFANYMTREGMPNGYSSRGGQALNPYNKEKDTGGSSAGSGVAIAARLATLAVGTETSGSIISPSLRNGLVGIKPTMGLVSRSGIVPISITQDTAGPMARTVKDTAILLNILQGYDQKDIATHITKKQEKIDYTKFLNGKNLVGIRIGVNKYQKEGGLDLCAEADLDKLCAQLKDAGATLIENIDLGEEYDIVKILDHEFKACMNYYLSTLGESTKLKTLDDIINYNQAHAKTALKYGQSLLLNSQNNSTGNLTEPEYIEALIAREQMISKLNKIFDENRLDAVLGMAFSSIAPFTGFPSMTVPLGQNQEDNMPIGSYWIAKPFNEGALVKIGHAVEEIVNFKGMFEV